MYILIIGIPIITGIMLSILGRKIGERGADKLAKIGIIKTWIIGIIIIKEIIKEGKETRVKIGEWINIGNMSIKYEIYYDKITGIMILLITTVSLIVVIYSIKYMEGEARKILFISKILIFVGIMLILVTSKNLINIYLGWEGVGIMSYLLINHYNKSIEANKSGIKAIIYNKVGDMGLTLGIGGLISINGSIDIIDIKSITEYSLEKEGIIIMLSIAAMAKSAQIGFHPWLGNAMIGPTPVSALIHAATMVTAGCYLLVRISNIIDITIIGKTIIGIIGALTIILGGIGAIAQNDIKKVIAYSTCSQLGYIFLTTSIGEKMNGIYHLLTHGFYKALLFLSAGILIHNLNDEQDLRRMGFSVRKSPLTYVYWLIGTLSIIGIPYMSGYYSKESIIESTFLSIYDPELRGGIYMYTMEIIGTILTGIYSMKILKGVFISKPRGNKDKYKSSEKGNEFELIVLVFCSIFSGFLFKSLNDTELSGEEENIPLRIKIIPVILSFLGMYLGLNIEKIWKLGTKINRVINRRIYIDNIFNMLTHCLLKSGYKITSKLLDRGVLELLGPLGLYRSVNFLSTFPYSSTHPFLRNSRVKESLNNYIIYIVIFVTLFLFL